MRKVKDSIQSICVNEQLQYHKNSPEVGFRVKGRNAKIFFSRTGLCLQCSTSLLMTVCRISRSTTMTCSCYSDYAMSLDNKRYLLYEKEVVLIPAPALYLWRRA